MKSAKGILESMKNELKGKAIQCIQCIPATIDIMQAIVVADRPYNLMDPGDYSDLCMIIQAGCTLGYNEEMMKNTLKDWEACDGPHFEEGEGVIPFTQHVLIMLGLISNIDK
jgi:hypothetical protein